MNAASQLAGAAQIARPLDSLPGAVQRINSATVRLQSFLDRWHGEQPAELAGGKELPETFVPHGQMFGRLFDALDRLEARVDNVDQLG